jgi:hypothetical protein
MSATWVTHFFAVERVGGRGEVVGDVVGVGVAEMSWYAENWWVYGEGGGMRWEFSEVGVEVGQGEGGGVEGLVGAVGMEGGGRT